jgi:hypothetical protein
LTLRGSGFPQAKRITDLRRVFDRPNDFDAVVVSTAEHTHAIATYLALTHGKHVYCEKPLAYNLWETRLIRETAARYPKLSTQMGNQGHASPMRRTIKEILDTGVIGSVKEVHVWADRRVGIAGRRVGRKIRQATRVLQGIKLSTVPEEMPVPANQLGPVLGPAGAAISCDVFPAALVRGGISEWHDERLAATTTTCRRVLDLCGRRAGGKVLAPISVESTSPNVPKAHKELAPATLMATFQFAANGYQPALKLVWHQGDSRPPGWVEAWGKRSCVFFGDKGMLLGNGKLLPEEKFKDFQTPPETLSAAQPGSLVEWVTMPRATVPCPGLNFQYSGWDGPETNTSGNVAYRTGRKLDWEL